MAYSPFSSFNIEKCLLPPLLLILEVWDLNTIHMKSYDLQVLVGSDLILL